MHSTLTANTQLFPRPLAELTPAARALTRAEASALQSPREGGGRVPLPLPPRLPSSNLAVELLRSCPSSLTRPSESVRAPGRR